MRICIFVKTGFHSSIICQKRRWSSLILLKWGFCSIILEKYQLNLAVKCLEYNKSVQSYGAEVEYEFPFLQCQRLKKSRTHSLMCWILLESTAAAGVELMTRRLQDGRYTNAATAETMRLDVVTYWATRHIMYRWIYTSKKVLWLLSVILWIFSQSHCQLSPKNWVS